jgi:hypothetical protein
VGCRLLDARGSDLASGTALVERDCLGGIEATVQALQPVGHVMLAIFGRGERHFQLELAGASPVPVELTASRWLDGGRRVCFFRSR